VVVSLVEICKQRLQTASAFCGLLGTSSLWWLGVHRVWDPTTA